MGFRDRCHRDADAEVTCIACGETVTRSDAREYDKHGDRWDREGKSFEYLCKPCDGECCHVDRTGLEDRLEAAGTGTASRGEFLRRYHDLVDGERTRTERR